MSIHYEMIDAGIRRLRSTYERVFPGRYAIAHDGHKVCVRKGGRMVRVDAAMIIMASDMVSVHQAIESRFRLISPYHVAEEDTVRIPSVEIQRMMKSMFSPEQPLVLTPSLYEYLETNGVLEDPEVASRIVKNSTLPAVPL